MHQIIVSVLSQYYDITSGVLWRKLSVLLTFLFSWIYHILTLVQKREWSTIESLEKVVSPSNLFIFLNLSYLNISAKREWSTIEIWTRKISVLKASKFPIMWFLYLENYKNLKKLHPTIQMQNRTTIWTNTVILQGISA